MMLNLVLINLSTRAVVRSSEIYASIEEATRALDRDPDLSENGISSWGNVNVRDVERLMMHTEDPDTEAFSHIVGWSQQYTGEEYFWSLFFDEKENG